MYYTKNHLKMEPQNSNEMVKTKPLVQLKKIYKTKNHTNMVLTILWI